MVDIYGDTYTNRSCESSAFTIDVTINLINASVALWENNETAWVASRTNNVTRYHAIIPENR